MIGKLINNYKITKKLGEGGMATVYLAEHSTLSRKAALKVLHVNLAENKEVLARFEMEAKTLDKLRHPNIVEIFDFGTFEDHAYLLMEYVDGMPLD
ncbi:MAG: protein kinase, partial [Bacteroidota bacterium]|nr:protein kinase [Bacteroidota bacterium]